MKTWRKRKKGDDDHDNAYAYAHGEFVGKLGTMYLGYSLQKKERRQTDSFLMLGYFIFTLLG